ncbi:MAG: 4Fe-4S binding protein [Xanthomonadales bacterium]|nr:4Fe-4S binding protein [Xanthomonadales bacterium]MCB1594842.1 4Fe-4S binding protein [Xanthomonadales bacterium]
MALKITEECINCDVCEPVCPNEAIYKQSKSFSRRRESILGILNLYEIPACSGMTGRLEWR